MALDYIDCDPLLFLKDTFIFLDSCDSHFICVFRASSHNFVATPCVYEAFFCSWSNCNSISPEPMNWVALPSSLSGLKTGSIPNRIPKWFLYFGSYLFSTVHDTIQLNYLK
uniref:SJCHGC04521 protein n=1 Tax=Schistosoma japonicum TaxID=6182 RepID=Q5DDR0_SCHJA|nr:SJCHGC04521 protein [Schistosoma japonicum]